MTVENSGSTIELDFEDALVAMAFLGRPNTTFDELARQMADKGMLKGVARVEILNHHPDGDADEILRRDCPELFKFNLSADHRAPLLGAFTLGVHGKEPLVPTALEGFPQEEVITLARAASEALLN